MHFLMEEKTDRKKERETQDEEKKERHDSQKVSKTYPSAQGGGCDLDRASARRGTYAHCDLNQ